MSATVRSSSASAARPPRVVSIGGGTGQSNLIGALRRLPCAIDAVVAMADDGRSTGLLRDRMGLLPPGDARKCLAALAADPGEPLVRAFEHRFEHLQRHTLGNLVLAALFEEGLDFAGAVSVCERLLGCVGHVLPSTADDIRLVGRTVDGRIVRGQAALSHGSTALDAVWLDPGGDAVASDSAVRAILDADLVVLGPGSLFTSIIPNLLVADIARAVRDTRALRVFMCPKVDTQGETWGMDGEECLAALERHGAAGAIDVAVFHRGRPAGGAATRVFQALAGPVAAAAAPFSCRDVGLGEEAERRLASRVPLVIVRDFTDPRSRAVHSPAVLVDCLRKVMELCRSRRR